MLFIADIHLLLFRTKLRDKWVLCHHVMARSQVADGGDESRTAENGVVL
jgi:hypothetical protein